MSALTPSQTELLLSPLLASLPAAAASPEPPTALLPHLSPILRQRVQLLSASSSDPWLPLLCYDSAKAVQLEKAVRNERLEAHPLSGEVEVDWEYEVDIRYKRVDEETLQSLVSFQELGLSARLVWCVNDEVGGGDGWRIGEVQVLDTTESSWGGVSIPAAEDIFESTTHNFTKNTPTKWNGLYTPEEDEEEDDDDYWAQYDKTPGGGNTPALKENSSRQTPRPPTDDDAYFAQYGSVQPAMDNHDPDEAQQNGEVESSLGKDEITRELQSTLAPVEYHPKFNAASFAWSDVKNGDMSGILHPRPSSSSSSNGSETVKRLEKQAAGSDHSETGIKQHISTSIKSLWRLAKVAGIEREEYDRLVRTELDCLAILDEDD